MGTHQSGAIPKAGGTGYTGLHERTCEVVTFNVTDDMHACGRAAYIEVRSKIWRENPPITVCLLHKHEYIDDLYQVTRL